MSTILDEKRAIEKLKYTKLYKDRPAYGDFDHSKGISKYILDTLKPKSIVDVGCGGGHFVELCKSHGIIARGVDIASPYDIIAPAHNIPLDDNSMEYLTSFDMMEHLIREDVPLVIKEFHRIATKGLVFKIAYTQSKGKGVDGELLHPTVEPQSWWVKRLKAEIPSIQITPIARYLICKFI